MALHGRPEGAGVDDPGEFRAEGGRAGDALLYQARCLRISVIPAARGAGTSPPVAEDERAALAGAGAAISALIIEKIQGFPMAARPTITLSQPVSAIIRAASPEPDVPSR
jgi:hypothetical protein